MTKLAFTASIGALALALSACGAPEPAADETPSDETGAASAETASTEAQADDDGEQTLQDRGVAPEWTEGADITETYLLPQAQAACEAIENDRQSEAFVEPVPAGSAFASRGPDARVRLAFKDGLGEARAMVIHTPSLPDGVRQSFDTAVADFMRHNLRRDADRAGTGVFRLRDGTFCVIQTDEPVVGALQGAADTVEALQAADILSRMGMGAEAQSDGEDETADETGGDQP